jgi:tetratricopeptide (TPR) repeat protein
VLCPMMQWEMKDFAALAGKLIATGLATPNRYNYLTLNPALCPYLRARMDAAERAALLARWGKAMRQYAEFLVQQQSQNTEVAATLTLLELPNLFALLDRVQAAGDAEATIGLTTSLYRLLEYAGKPRLLARVGQARDAAGDAWSHARFEAVWTRVEQQLAGGRLREAFEGAQALLQRARTAGAQAYPDADYDLAMACFILARVLQTAGGSEQALPLLEEARRHFEAVEKREPGRGAERMASVCFTEQGDCLRGLGRLDDAAADAYRKSLAIKVRLGDVGGQASTLNQLGRLCFDLARTEEAAAFYRQTVDKYVEIRDVAKEGVARNNLGDTLRKLRRLDEARQEIRRAIECGAQFGHASSPWASWAVLAGIETDAGNATTAAEAKRHAMACYLAYRRDGGENHSDSGRLVLAVTQKLRAGDLAGAASLLHDNAATYKTASWRAFIRALQAIVAGSRDRALADAPELGYSMAAEILFLIETLEKPR